MGSFGRAAVLSLTIPVFVGCESAVDRPLIVATTWPLTERTQIEAAVREPSTNLGPIVWVDVAPGESLESVVDRRGGVDILIGGSTSAYVRLARAGRLVLPNPGEGAFWRAVRRPNGEDRSTVKPRAGFRDPRLDPESLALAKSILRTQGWPKGYEALVRALGVGRSTPGPSVEASVPQRSESLALVRGGPNPSRAIAFVQALESRGIAGPLSADPIPEAEAAVDSLLADLLGSALVDAHEELRQAVAALDRFGHPAEAEAAIGQRPPWPPASVLKLRAGPGGEALLETLLEQVAPDPAARAWLLESWSRPKRTIDADLLLEIAEAVDGRLAREPRFRAWLGGEWTAWTRQLYRRVARVAGGYVPS